MDINNPYESREEHRMTIETKPDGAEHNTASSGATQASVTETCHVQLTLEGMTCASCAMRIEKSLKKLPGILEASVNLATEQGMVTYDPTQTDVAKMVQKVDALGYKAIPQDGSTTETTPTTSVTTSTSATR